MVASKHVTASLAFLRRKVPASNSKGMSPLSRKRGCEKESDGFVPKKLYGNGSYLSRMAGVSMIAVQILMLMEGGE